MLGTRISDFLGFWNICIYVLRYSGDDLNQNRNAFVSYTAYGNGLKVILYSIFDEPSQGQVGNIPLAVSHRHSKV